MSEAALSLCDHLAVYCLGVLEDQLGASTENCERQSAADDDLDPLTLLKPAALGDVQAQRTLSMFCASVTYRAVKERVTADQTPVMAEAILMARLAAAHGDPVDSYRLAVLLGMGSSFATTPAEREEWAAECIARFELLADDGHEGSAELLVNLAGRETPEVLNMARRFRARLLAIKESK